MHPFKCTANSYGHVDYGIPILALKGTDYRPSTGTYHRFIPSFPQNFDCRVKAKLKKGVLEKDLLIREDVRSTYTKDYFEKANQDDASLKITRAPICHEVQNIRTIQEKVYQHSPPPLKPGISDMKDAYQMKTYSYGSDEVAAPVDCARCQITGLERPLQPTIAPEQKGFWKYLDIYLTNNKIDYVPYSEDQIINAGDDIITHYSATGVYKDNRYKLPGPLTGNKSVFDKTVFRHQFPNKFLSSGPKRVPYLGMQTEYQGRYRTHTYSDLCPYIHENGITFGDSLPEAGAWQNLCPNGMYCAESRHIGTGWPVRAVVDIETKKFIPHERCGANVLEPCH